MKRWTAMGHAETVPARRTGASAQAPIPEGPNERTTPSSRVTGGVLSDGPRETKTWSMLGHAETAHARRTRPPKLP